ncbi:prolyl oligopeptidase family serine peptidase [Ferrimonas senticii]|uniref:prolyl oligopeptidase family serine peptidase n=1 Tax=Ferrimonas senticii TaxID=394566 RepID=UPI000409CD62|nr:prolyl oligopeptidase family serine peptidase [Ferrimonas senticii]
MNQRITSTLWAAAAAMILSGCQQTPVAITAAMPQAASEPLVEQLHGVAVADPYRYLEQPQDPRTQSWVKQQQQYGEDYLAGIANREVLEQRIAELWDYPSQRAPQIRGQMQLYFANDGLQSQDVLYLQIGKAQPRVLLDPNTFSDDGTVALSGTSLSPDGKVLAYGTSVSGSDWQTWQFLDVATGEPLADKLEWLKFTSAEWAKDGSGVWYARYDQPNADSKLEQVNYHQKLYFHRLGDVQSQDQLVYERPDKKEWGFGTDVTDDGKHLLIYVWQGTSPKVGLFINQVGSAEVKPLLTDFDASYAYLGDHQGRLLFLTDKDAPNSKVVAIDPDKPTEFKTVLAQGQWPIDQIKLVNGHLAVVTLKDVLADLNLYDLNGTLVNRVELPGAGRVRNLKGQADGGDLYFEYNSYTQPSAVYRFDFAEKQLVAHSQPQVAFNPDDFVTEQVFYHSKDGTRVPMLISYKKGLQKDGTNPTLLYAYGGFNISVTPRFSPANIAWMELGGIYAVPNIRGGAEYGEAWHQAALYGNKQNVFDDYYAAAAYLIANGYTNPSKLGGYGRSNGGLLMGAALTQRPDLFAALLPAVGVLDMLRFHKFTIGWAWVSEYGSADNPQQFPFLKAYSPYHNVAKRDYPATMVMTADHDDRVVPAHSFKFTAMVQQQQQGSAPIIARIESNAGHGAGKPTAMRIAEYRDIFAFLMASFKQPLPAQM